MAFQKFTHQVSPANHQLQLVLPHTLSLYIQQLRGSRFGGIPISKLKFSAPFIEKPMWFRLHADDIVTSFEIRSLFMKNSVDTTVELVKDKLIQTS